MLLIINAEAMGSQSCRDALGTRCRRQALATAISCLLPCAVAPMARADELTAAQRKMKMLGSGSKNGVSDGDDLIGELLRRTEVNKDRNEAMVKRATEANAFTAIDGSVGRKLVTNMSGENMYLSESEVRMLIQQRRLACAPNIMEACRMVDPADPNAKSLELPVARTLECDRNGRNCKFE